MARLATTPPRLTREDQKTQRINRILDHARSMMAEDGFDALKIRELAARANITVPTIYNLIGGKRDILAHIIDALVAKLHAVQMQTGFDDIEASFEAQINRLTNLFSEDEDFYRAAFLAGDRSGLFEQSSEHGIFARSLLQPVQTCRAAQAQGLLRGDIGAEQLGRQIYDSYRLARQDWTNGYYGVVEFRERSLAGVFMALAADATPAFKKRLLTKIADAR